MTQIASSAPPVFRSIEGEARFMAAYDAVLSEGRPEALTRDLGGTAGTDAFADAVIGKLK